MTDKAPWLTHFLQSEHNLPNVAQTPQECQVGPCHDELPSDHRNSFNWDPNGVTPQAPTDTTSSNTSNADVDVSNHKKRKLQDSPSTAATTTTTTTTTTFSHAVGTFLSSGCCMIPHHVLPRDFVVRCKAKATKDLNFLQDQLRQRRQEALDTQQPHLLAAVQRGDFRELVDRDGGRRDVRFQLDRFPYTAPGLVYNPLVFPLVKELLGGGDVNLLYAGVMWASPLQQPHQEENVHQNHQKWHGDGGHLYHHTNLPPHCINVFYPLIDLTCDNGPTEFMTGTHRLGKFNSNETKPISLCCKAGGAILFDYRIKHRGKANLSSTLEESRPVLYLAYAKPFFRDAGNIRAGNSLVASSSNVPSPPWVSRILNGKAVAAGEGFDCDNDVDNDMKDKQPKSNKNHIVNAQSVDSGERWVLFRMNVELEGCEEPQIITVHHGDLASELSEQFCRTHQLPNDFISVLTNTIQQQMDACKP